MKRPERFDRERALGLVARARAVLPALADGCGSDLWGPMAHLLLVACEEVDRLRAEVEDLRNELVEAYTARAESWED